MILSLLAVFFLFGPGLLVAKFLFPGQSWFWTVSLAALLDSAIFVNLAWFLWFLGIPFDLIVSLYSLISVISYSVMLWKGISLSSLKEGIVSVCKDIWKVLSEQPFLAMILPIIFFTIFIIMGWSFFVQPVTWDAITLYDFRAHRIADGASLGWFWSQFPSAGWYDFSHPFGGSLLYALIYSLGGTIPWILNGFIFLGVVCLGLSTWKSWEARGLWLLFTIVTRTTLELFTDAYPTVFIWSWWWGIFLIFSVVKIGWQRYLAVLILLLGIMNTRIAEPFWLLTVGWILVLIWSQREKHTLSLTGLYVTLPLLVAATWRNIWRGVYLQSTGTEVSISPQGTSDLLLSISRVFTLFMSQKQMFIGVILSLGLLFYLWKKGNLSREILWKFIGTLSFIALFLGGIAWISLSVHSSVWPDIRLAAPRSAIAPTVAVLWLMTELFEVYFLGLKKRQTHSQLSQK